MHGGVAAPQPKYGHDGAQISLKQPRAKWAKKYLCCNFVVKRPVDRLGQRSPDGSVHSGVQLPTEAAEHAVDPICSTQ